MDRGGRAGFAAVEGVAWSDVEGAAEKAVRGLGGGQADSELATVLVLTTFWMLLSSCSSCSSLLASSQP